MPRPRPRSNARSRRPLLFTLIALLGLTPLAAGSYGLFQPTAHAGGGEGQPAEPALSNAAVGPGAIAFSSPSYTVTEAAGSATITFTRTGGTDDQVVGKVTLSDVTTSAADYLSTPGVKDTTFNAGGAGANHSVDSLALQPDGKLIVGGIFTTYNGDSTVPDCVMRLNADGTPDMTFNPGGRVRTALCTRRRCSRTERSSSAVGSPTTTAP